jgi:hypothetical protein
MKTVSRKVGKKSKEVNYEYDKMVAEGLESLMRLEGWFEGEDEKRADPDSIGDENSLPTTYF